MLKSIKLRAILILIFLAISVIYCLPNVIEPQGVWKKYLPSDKMHLGLDLKGGMHLLLELDTVKLVQNIADRKFNAFKDAMIRDGVRFLGLDAKENAFLVTIRPEQKEKLYNIVGKEFSDLKAGTTRTEGENIVVEFLMSTKD